MKTIGIALVAALAAAADAMLPGATSRGGNVTGIAAFNSELGGKRLNLLSDLVPQATTIAFLSGPTDREAQNTQMLEAAHALGRQVLFLTARGERDYEQVFATIVEHGGRQC